MIKAIETSYKGYRFRSRLEARWAVFFDALGVRWEYEPEGFELPSGRYLPDFRLPDMPFRWVEVKGTEPIKRELQLAQELCVLGNEGVFVSHGLPDEPGITFFTNSTYRKSAFFHCLSSKSLRDRFTDAAAAARGARFEHGESGAWQR